MTPLVYKQTLWERSGHWDFYRDDMTLLAVGRVTAFFSLWRLGAGLGVRVFGSSL